MNNRGMSAAHLQETMMLMREMGLEPGPGGGSGGGGGDGYCHIRQRRREINPLQRARRRVNRGVVVSGGDEGLVAASTAAAAAAAAGIGGQMQSGPVAVPGTARDSVVESGQEGGTIRQHAAEEVDKLVDV